MTVFTEGDLRIVFNGALEARKFDGDCHGLSHCMKAVDFIVEYPDEVWFIEFKDPENRFARESDSGKFVREFQSGDLDEGLTYKYRDSFLYEWAAGRAEKPVSYFVLIAIDSLSEAELSSRTDDLRRRLPLRVPEAVSWTRPIVKDCVVFNIKAWNRNLSDCPIARVSP